MNTEYQIPAADGMIFTSDVGQWHDQPAMLSPFPLHSLSPSQHMHTCRASSSTAYGMPPYGLAQPLRSNSRGRETSSRERSRPNSAPAKQRFDPTDYIRQRKEREKAMVDRRNRAPTPPRSGNTSGRSSPAGVCWHGSSSVSEL